MGSAATVLIRLAGAHGAVPTLRHSLITVISHRDFPGDPGENRVLSGLVNFYLSSICSTADVQNETLTDFYTKYFQIFKTRYIQVIHHIQHFSVLSTFYKAHGVQKENLANILIKLIDNEDPIHYHDIYIVLS